MRVTALLPALLLISALPAFAQEPIDYVSKLDYFSINMPVEPKVEHRRSGTQSLQGDRRRLP
jgi:hypothetical protein